MGAAVLDETDGRLDDNLKGHRMRGKQGKGKTGTVSVQIRNKELVAAMVKWCNAQPVPPPLTSLAEQAIWEFLKRYDTKKRGKADRLDGQMPDL